MDRVFRILSLDGGGRWALIQAKALLDIYGDVSGRVVLAKFDLVAANSGGSIVAAALAANFKPSDIVAYFMDEGWRRKIFVDLPWYQKIPRILGLGPRFSTSSSAVPADIAAAGRVLRRMSASWPALPRPSASLGPARASRAKV